MGILQSKEESLESEEMMNRKNFMRRTDRRLSGFPRKTIYQICIHIY